MERKQLISSLLLLTSLAFLGGCSIPLEVTTHTDCIWYTPTHFTPETKAWLAANNPPQAVITDLDWVAKNNEKSRKYCPELWADEPAAAPPADLLPEQPVP